MHLQPLGKIGQKYVIGFSGTEVSSELRDIVERYHFGNFILFRENLVDAAQTRKLCQDLRSLALEVTGIVPLICIDQEGGMVTRLEDDRLNIPGAMALASTGDMELVRRMNRINGSILQDLGFNLNLAPVLDVNNEADNPVIGCRSYGDQAEAVAAMAGAAYAGLHDSGILAAAKHFPGHGDTKVDSHLGLPSVSADRETLEKRELLPFQRLIDQKVDAIMTTHILFPALETERIPATMSRRILTGLLREEMGFAGLIVSDCMEMEAISTHYGLVEGVVKGFAAGVDLVCVSHTPQAAAESFDAVVAALEAGTLSEAELDRSVDRILEAKQRLNASVPALTSAELVDYGQEIHEAMAQTYCVLPEGSDLVHWMGEKKILVMSPEPTRVSNVNNQALAPISFSNDLASELGAKGLGTALRPDEVMIQSALEASQEVDSVILGLYNAHVYTEQLKLWSALRDAGKEVLAVALRNPYDLMFREDGETAVAIYEYTNKGIKQLAACLLGKAQATGRLPIVLAERRLK